MRLVPIKTDEQMDLQALHRVRDRWGGKTNGRDESDPRVSAGTWNRHSERTFLPDVPVADHL
jgi:hypothetical protein